MRPNLPILIAAVGALTACPPSPLKAIEPPESLAVKVADLFKARCADCHGATASTPKEFQIIEDLAALRQSEFVDLKTPENSKLYTVLRDSEMPLLTRAEKQEGKKRVDLVSEEDVARVLAWIRAGAPDLPGARAVAASNTPSVPGPASTAATISGAATTPPAAPQSKRRTVDYGEVLAGALTDLQSLPPEERAGTRYVSLLASHNNTREVSDGRLELLRSGVRKMMNSLSTNPAVATFAEVGPEKILFRIRLRDLHWTPELWDRIASFFPQAVEMSLSPAVSAMVGGTKVAILPAEWMAATATRAPLYHEILDLPPKLADLEKRLGVNVAANLASGEALRSGFTESGVSRFNRLVERHALQAWAGFYWLSYDFREGRGKASLPENPLGPESAGLAGGAHAFKHAGSEVIFSLPNGCQAYYLANVLGDRLDGPAPTEIVSDRSNVTGRSEVSNGLSCIICHDRGMKDAPRDEIRSLAPGFSAEQQRLIERLHPPQEKIDAMLKADGERFLAALASGGVKQDGPTEPIGALARRFERPVTLAEAAAELGLTEEEFQKRLDPQKQPKLFDVATLLDSGTLSREHFLDRFPEIVQRLNLGQVRPATPLAAVKQPGHGAGKPRPIAVRIRTDKAVYSAGDAQNKKGDLLYATVEAAEAGHLRLLYQNAKGEVIFLFPNQFHKDDRIPGGTPIRVPGDNDGFDVEIVGPPVGVEHLVAIVTDQPFTDDEALKAELAKTQFAEATTSDLEVAVAKSARVIKRDDRGRPTARAGFARVTIESHE